MIDLRLDLLDHFRCEDDALVAAFEIILTAEVGMLMEDHLIHVEFIKVSVKKRNYDGVKFHVPVSFHE